MLPLVSILLTSYNQEESLPRAFHSILDQTYENIEIIIADDCSTDGVSQDYIRSLALKYPRVVKYTLQEKNVGVAANRNSGLRMCNGSYITYLDGDDFYLPNKIEKEVEAFAVRPDLDVVYSNFIYCSPDGLIDRAWKGEDDIVPEGDIFKDLISMNFPGYNLYRFELMKRDVLLKNGYFDESIRAFEDWDLRIRYSSFSKVGYCDNLGS